VSKIKTKILRRFRKESVMLRYDQVEEHYINEGFQLIGLSAYLFAAVLYL
jgi:hypothetical protein